MVARQAVGHRNHRADPLEYMYSFARAVAGVGACTRAAAAHQARLCGAAIATAC